MYKGSTSLNLRSNRN